MEKIIIGYLEQMKYVESDLIINAKIDLNNSEYIEPWKKELREKIKESKKRIKEINSCIKFLNEEKN